MLELPAGPWQQRPGWPPPAEANLQRPSRAGRNQLKTITGDFRRLDRRTWRTPPPAPRALVGHPGIGRVADAAPPAASLPVAVLPQQLRHPPAAAVVQDQDVRGGTGRLQRLGELDA